VNDKKTILYAEDDLVTLTAYKNRLEGAGYIVHAAKDGLEAMRLLHSSPPDLILLDLMLPKFTGEEVLKHMITNPALGRIPVIVLSTNSILTAANEPLLGLAGKHLLKHDCTFAKLQAAIEEVLAAAAASNRPTESAVQPEQSEEAFQKNIEKLKAHNPVVCAWTDRIQVEDQWMSLTEFLSQRLHLQVSHGVSPEGAQMLLGNKEAEPPAPGA
jgi:CheY-like chemotaxis protein